MKKFDPDAPYNELPLLPPRYSLETPGVLKACIEANKELAKLKIAERLIPNQTVLINCIPLLESQASSAIENIVTTTDELFEYAQSVLTTTPSATKETLQYRQALNLGYKLLQKRPLSTAIVCEICSTIRQVDVDIRDLPGTVLMNDFSGEKIYTPPEGEGRLRNLLDNWLDYLHQDDDGIDPLIKLAVQHYQFEAIHPFSDGNGRTGRIVNLLYLIQRGLLDTPILYLSGYIIKNRAEYYKRLLDVTAREAWEEWILYFLDAIFETSKWTLSKILAIQKLLDESCVLIKLKAPTIYSKELVELLFTQPYIRIQNLVESEGIGRDTASKRLKILSGIGFLQEVKRGRDRLFINHRFLNLLKQKE
ncbi:MAG: Fic family protein [Candidatus Algichlamydia australiensis]|nr:Fic family protein [Chlamydiales bacterium]